MKKPLSEWTNEEIERATKRADTKFTKLAGNLGRTYASGGVPTREQMEEIEKIKRRIARYTGEVMLRAFKQKPHKKRK